LTLAGTCMPSRQTPSRPRPNRVRFSVELQRFSRACHASFRITLTSSVPRMLERSRRHSCRRRTAVPLSAPVRRVARPARRPRPHDGGVGWGSPVAGEPTVPRRGWSLADRVLTADAVRDRRRTGPGAIAITRLKGRRRSKRPSAAEAVVRRERWRPVSRGGASDARDTRQHVNRLRRPLCRAGHEYADGDRQTPMMTSRLTAAAANPSRRGPRQPGRRRGFPPRGGGRAGRHGLPARTS
jgi:hypothetical protein